MLSVMIKNKRLMGLDVGDRRIGVALTDITGSIAYPETVIVRKRREDVFSAIGRLAEEKKVGEVVVGLPINMDGTHGERTEKVLEFVSDLSEKTGLNVRLWDERLTTREAEHVLIKASVSRKKRKKVIDKLAAQLILQSYVDSVNAS